MTPRRPTSSSALIRPQTCALVTLVDRVRISLQLLMLLLQVQARAAAAPAKEPAAPSATAIAMTVVETLRQLQQNRQEEGSATKTGPSTRNAWASSASLRSISHSINPIGSRQVPPSQDGDNTDGRTERRTDTVIVAATTPGNSTSLVTSYKRFEIQKKEKKRKKKKQLQGVHTSEQSFSESLKPDGACRYLDISCQHPHSYWTLQPIYGRLN